MTTAANDTFNALKEPAPVVDEDGTKRWYNADGQIHRENDKPAVIRTDGSKEWWIDGVLIRREP